MGTLTTPLLSGAPFLADRVVLLPRDRTGTLRTDDAKDWRGQTLRAVPSITMESNTTPARRNHPRRFRPQRQTRALMMAEPRVTVPGALNGRARFTLSKPPRRVDPGPITAGNPGNGRIQRHFRELLIEDVGGP